jgi:cytochrome c oxidase subunit II
MVADGRLVTGAGPPTGSRGRTGWALAGPAVVAALVAAAGCGDDSPSALDPDGDAAQRIAGLWWLLFALGLAVYAVVGALIVASWRRRATALRANRFIVVGGVIVPAVVLAVAGVETVRTTDDVFEAQGRDADVVVEGETWWWRVTYPNDGVVTANEVHIPTGEQVTVELASDDVVHSFWVPELAPKVDLIPGQTNEIVLQADRPGTYLGACAEFCGVQHANMRFVVVAQEPDEFRSWLSARRHDPPRPTGEAAEGQDVFFEQPCSGCHRVAGTAADALVGPDLTDFGSRRWIGAGVADNTPENLARWVHDAPSLKPGVLMPPIALSDEEIDALVAYLEGLEPR